MSRIEGGFKGKSGSVGFAPRLNGYLTGIDALQGFSDSLLTIEGRSFYDHFYSSGNFVTVEAGSNNNITTDSSPA